MKWKKLVSVHTCELQPEADPLKLFIPGDSFLARHRRAFRRSCTISMKNPRSRRIFKSSASISFERIRQLKTHYYIIHPLSDFRQIWENFMFFMYLLSMIVTPYYNAFISNNPDKWDMYYWVILDAAICVICVCDIFVNFFTGYIESYTVQGIVLIPWKIILLYCQTYLLIDIISSFPIDHLTCVIPPENDWICDHSGKLRFLKILRLKTLSNYFMRGCELLDVEQNKAELIAFILRGIIIIHFCACGNMMLAKLSFPTTRTWLSDYMEKNLTLRGLYVQSLVCVTASLCVLGYGYEDPGFFLPQFYICVLSIVGSIFMLSAIVLFSKRVNMYNLGSSRYGEKMAEIKNYVRYKQLPRELHKRIIEYYEFRYYKFYFDEKTLFRDLSSNLKQEFLLHRCRRLLLNVGFFNKLPPSLLLRIMLCMHVEIYLVNDVIIKAGTNDDSMYFITSGTVAIYTSEGKEVCHLEDGEHFGEVSLLSEAHERSASVVAVESSEIYRLDKSDFDRAVAPYPDLLSRLRHVAEERIERATEADQIYRRHMQERVMRATRERMKSQIIVPSKITGATTKSPVSSSISSVSTTTTPAKRSQHNLAHKMF